MNILMVLSSCAQIPGGDRKTGAWFEELAAPFYAFDGKLITGQNPASSEAAAERLLEALR